MSRVRRVSVREAVAALRRGEAVAFPTPSGYGVALDPFRAGSGVQLGALKPGRRSPVGLIAADLAQVEAVAHLPAGASDWLARWPAELTLVLPAREGLPAAVVSAEGGVALRIPAPAGPRALARAHGGALTATSANRPGETPAGTLAELDALSLDFLRLALGGAVGCEPPSAIVSLLGAEPQLLRPGAACPSLQR
jgi:L-threonylcarbamoyladenylate synthase